MTALSPSVRAKSASNHSEVNKIKQHKQSVAALLRSWITTPGRS